MSLRCNSQHRTNNDYGNFGSSLSKKCCNTSTRNAGNTASVSNIAIMLIPTLLSCAGNYLYSTPTSNTNKTSTKDDKTTQDVKSETEVKNETKEAPEVAVKRILTEAGITADDNIIKQVAEKYPTMQAIKVAGLTVEDRVVNYAKGLKFDSTTDNFILAQLNNKPSDNVHTIENGEGENEGDKLKNGYIQFAQEQIELYDNMQSANGSINLTEYFAKELADCGINQDDLTDAQADEALAKTKIIFDGLDVNGNGELDKTEIAALSWVRSTFSPDLETQNTTNFDTTYDEWQNTNSVLDKFQEAVLKLPTDKMQEFKSKFDNGNRLDALLLLKDNCGLSTEEFDSIGYFFRRYDQSVVGFVNHIAED